MRCSPNVKCMQGVHLSLDMPDLVDFIKVLFGHSDPELGELCHVSVVDHPVSQNTLTLMDPEADHLDRLPEVVLVHAQQTLHHITDRACLVSFESLKLWHCRSASTAYSSTRAMAGGAYSDRGCIAENRA